MEGDYYLSCVHTKLVSMLMMVLGLNGATETNVLLSSVDARDNALTRCEWVLNKRKIAYIANPTNIQTLQLETFQIQSNVIST